MPAAPLSSRVAFTATSLMAGAGAFAFDWNATHIDNPTWSPHAKFHNAQTMSLGAGLAAATLVALWGPRASWSRGRLDAGASAATLYWVTQLSALAYPGTALGDPPHEDRYAQAIVASAALAASAVGYVLERRALTSA